MALKYVVKKRVFGFDKTKTEKYVAQNVITNTVNFRDLCKEVSICAFGNHTEHGYFLA